jgi:hypothetical protein
MLRNGDEALLPLIALRQAKPLLLRVIAKRCHVVV